MSLVGWWTGAAKGKYFPTVYSAAIRLRKTTLKLADVKMVILFHPGSRMADLGSNNNKKRMEKINCLLLFVAVNFTKFKIIWFFAVFRIHMFFWASRIRIHQSDVWIRLRIRILPSSCKNSKKNLDSFYFVTLFDFLSLKNDVNVPSKSSWQKKLC